MTKKPNRIILKCDPAKRETKYQQTGHTVKHQRGTLKKMCGSRKSPNSAHRKNWKLMGKKRSKIQKY